MKDRLEQIKRNNRSKKLHMQQFSDHYTLMFELMRRIKLKLRRVTDKDISSLAKPGGCIILLHKFFKEFPRIAKSHADVQRIISEGVSLDFLKSKTIIDD